MNIKMDLFVLTALLLTIHFSVHASNVADEDLNIFEPNTPASASEVNTNFTNLKNAINDNNAKIDSVTTANNCVGMFVTGIGADGKVICEDPAPDNSRTGMTPSNPAPNCKAILESGDSFGSGSYYIDPNGGSPDDTIKVYCDMVTDGGGWTLCGKFDRDNAGGTSALASPFARANVNVSDLKSVTGFTDFQSSQDCRELIRMGASQILNIGTDKGSKWDFGRIIDIIDEIKIEPAFLWDITLDEDGIGACAENIIITRNMNGVDLGATDGTNSLSQRAGLLSDRAFWIDSGRTGATFSNAGATGCTGTGNDTVYWSWVDVDGALDNHGCGSPVVGTGCNQSTTWSKPTYRFNLMFMR